MECCNPGGTGKDRAALFMLRDLEQRGILPPPLSSSSSSSSYRVSYDNDSVPLHPIEKEPTSTSSTSPITTTPTTTSDTTIKSTIQTAASLTRTGGIVVEGTSGSTGISLATLCARRGHAVIVVTPDDQAEEKRLMLRRLGAVVHVVPNASISNAEHYVNVARRIAEVANGSTGGGWGNDEDGKTVRAAFVNQFENEANYRAHVETTGPEIWEQMNGLVDAFCMSSGTGATLAGVGRCLKDRSSVMVSNKGWNDNDDDDGGSSSRSGSSRSGGSSSSSSSVSRRPCHVVLVDPPGSVLYNKIKYNVAYTTQQRERTLLRHRYDTLAEGIGLDRITHNFALGLVEDVHGRRQKHHTQKKAIDDAVRVSDQEAVDMAHWLLENEGLFVGSSSAMNIVGAVRVAMGDDSGDDDDDDNNNGTNNKDNGGGEVLGPGARIVTVVCDGGQRHQTRFWNRDFVCEWGLSWPGDDRAAWMKRLPCCLTRSLE